MTSCGAFIGTVVITLGLNGPLTSSIESNFNAMKTEINSMKSKINTILAAQRSREIINT